LDYKLEVDSSVTSVTLFADLKSDAGALITWVSDGTSQSSPNSISASVTLNLAAGSAIGQVRCVITNSSPTIDNIYTLEVTCRGSISIGTGDENIPITISPLSGSKLILYKNGSQNSATVSINDPSGIYNTVSWRVDGGAFKSIAKTGNDWSFSLDVNDYEIKNDHELSIMVNRGGVYYAANYYFDVVM